MSVALNANHERRLEAAIETARQELAFVTITCMVPKPVLAVLLAAAERQLEAELAQ